MGSKIALRHRNDAARQRLHAEAAAFCARFGIERDPEVSGIALSDAEANTTIDRELLADVLSALGAMLDAGEEPTAPAAAPKAKAA